jgi:hypothetical protein
LWETLIGVSGQPGWIRQRSRRAILRLVDASWKQVQAAVAVEHGRFAHLVSESIRASTALALEREQAIAREIAQRDARMAAHLLQPGLFDRRVERRATALREVTDNALAHCDGRLAELQRQRTLTAALRPAFSLIAW